VWRISGAIAAILAGCGSSPARDLQVVSWSPEGAIERVEPVEIRFDRAVVESTLVGQSAAPTSISFAPPIAWRGTWRDRQTLVVEPLSPLAPSTRYRVTLAGELRARAGALAFSFVHQPLAVEGIWGADANALAPSADLPLSFDQPVDPGDAAAHCRLIGERGTIALAPTSNDPAPDLALHPVQPLEPGAAYTLACAGLAGAGGNAPLDQPYTLAVRARPELAVARAYPEAGYVLPDGARLAFTFSTPVALDAARDAVSANPVIPGIDRGTLSADGMTYEVTADLASDTDYRISIAGLIDRTGQRLSHPFELPFHTAKAGPRLVATQGPDEAVAVWSRDVDSFDAACLPLTRDTALALATGAPSEAVAMAGALTQRRAVIADQRWHQTRVDCGGPGLYLVELRARSQTPIRALLQTGDLHVRVVTAPSNTVAWVTSRATGRPIAGARVTVMTISGRPVASELATDRGLVKLPARRGEDWVVAAENGGDLEVTRVDGGDQRPAGSTSEKRGSSDGGDLCPAGSISGSRCRWIDRPPTRAGNDRPAVAPASVSSSRLTIRARTPAPRPGERLAFVVAARAPDGTPWAGARVQWTLHRRSHAIQVAGYERFAFASEPDARDDSVIADGAAATDVRGELVIAARDGAPRRDEPVDYVLIATALDASGSVASTTLAVTSDPAPFRLGLRVDAIAPPAGVPFEIALVAISPDGAPSAADGRLTIARVERRCSVVATPAGTRTRCTDRRQPLFERELELTSGAAREERVELAAPGLYIIGGRSRDREASVERAIWVPGAGAPADDDGRVTMIADRRCDGGRLAALTGRARATALVAFEREGVLEARVIDLAAAGDPIDLGSTGPVRATIALAGEGWSATGTLDQTAPPFGGAAGRAQVPAVDQTAPPFGGAAGRAQVPAACDGVP
jgi:hypothetical protein